MMLGVERMRCAIGIVGSGAEGVGLGGADVGERRVREGGLARAMAQKGQVGLVLCVLGGGGIGS